MNKDVSFFYCYNKRVSDFLSNEGIKFITVAKDLKKGRVFSMYIIDDKLQKALDKYNQQKP